MTPPANVHGFPRQVDRGPVHRFPLLPLICASSFAPCGFASAVGKKQPFGVRARVISGWSRTPPGAQSLEWLRDVDAADASAFLLGLNATGEGLASFADADGGIPEVDARLSSSSARTFHELLVRNVYYSPRIELLRSLERIDRARHGGVCAAGAAWALLLPAGAEAPRAACDAAALRAELSIVAVAADVAGGAGGAAEAAKASTAADLDLVLRRGGGRGTAVVYGAISAEGLPSLVPLLREVASVPEAASGVGWRIVFRHADGPRGSASRGGADNADDLTGYGFELAIKSSEYKTHPEEEQGQEAGAAGGPGDGGAAATDGGSLEGDLAVNELLEVAEDIDAMLTETEIRDIGLQAVAKVKASSTPLLQLMRLAQDFPAHVVGLARSAVPDEVREGAKSLRSWMREGAEVFSINGRLVRPGHSELSVFPVIKTMQPIFVAVERMARVGVSEVVACELLRESHGTKLPERLDWRSAHLPPAVYSVEKDKKAQSWGDSLHHLMYVFPGQLAPIRRPFYRVVFAFDPAELADLQQAADFVASTPLPIALHLVPVPAEIGGARAPLAWDEQLLGSAPAWLKAASPEDGGGAKTAVGAPEAIAAAFGDLLVGNEARSGSPKAARSFLKALGDRAVELQKAGERRWPGSDDGVAEVKALWRNSLPKDAAADADAAWASVLRVPRSRGGFVSNATQYVSSLGVPLPSVLVNGKLLLKGAYDGEQSILPTIVYEQQVLQRAVYTGALRRAEDVDAFLASLGFMSAYHEDISPEVAQRGGEEGMPGQTATTTYFQWPIAAFADMPFLYSLEPQLAEGEDSSSERHPDAGRLLFFHVTVLRSLEHAHLLHTFATHLLEPDRSAVTGNLQIVAPPFESRWSVLVAAGAEGGTALAEFAACVHGAMDLERTEAGAPDAEALNRQRLQLLKFLGVAVPAAVAVDPKLSGERVRELCELGISTKVEPAVQERLRGFVAGGRGAGQRGRQRAEMIGVAGEATGVGDAALWVCNGRQVVLPTDGQPVYPNHVQALEFLEAQYDVANAGRAEDEEELEQPPDEDQPPKAAAAAAVRPLHEWLSERSMGGGALPSKVHGLVAAIRSEALSHSQNQRFTQPAEIFERAPAAMRLTLPPARREAASPIKVFGILDPVSEIAQSASAVLALFGMTFNAEVNLVLNPILTHREYPLKRYYREVIRWPAHLADGRATSSLLGGSGLVEGKADFSLATKHVLTAAVHVLPTWLVTAFEAEHDMDNLRQVDVGDGKWCETTYLLRQLYVEGQAFIMGEDGWPVATAKGLQIEVRRQGVSQESPSDDTIVMGNLGYFQVHGNPGVYEVSLKPGLANDTFAIANSPELAVSSYITPPYQLRVTLRPGRNHEDLFEQGVTSSRRHAGGVGGVGGASIGDGGGGLTGLLAGLRSILGFGGKDQADASKSEAVPMTPSGGPGGGDDALPTIHIFSVASGHLYEKLLSIMILSVRSNTKCPLHFWFIDNFLSPKFKVFIPSLAKQYNFSFDFVTYKWPSWLNPQSEKQRLIWAYKVLFLDVLFPQDVPKVLFIDADQVVRADVRELWDMDLGGKVYGFVPMGDTNPDTEGFRFWKQGYWKNHLRDLPYHISALYVVDLVEFRRTSIGDSLRGVYNQLSQDPNSLSNLEQDLVNFAQHQVPIHTLPDEWLWCETWCSQESKVRAKTIDLCQNPLTKEPKIVMAKRIIKEWQTYHDEVQRFQDSLEGRRQAASATVDSAGVGVDARVGARAGGHAEL